MVARQAKIVPLPTQPATLEKQLLTIKQVQEHLQVGRDEVYRLIREGELAVVSLGGNKRRVKPSTLARFINEREKSQGA
jgi:excisionase family DNA binding protein